MSFFRSDIAVKLIKAHDIVLTQILTRFDHDNALGTILKQMYVKLFQLLLAICTFIPYQDAKIFLFFQTVCVCYSFPEVTQSQSM